MKDFFKIVLALSAVTLAGCSDGVESCDVDTYHSTCLITDDMDMMETCTINSEIVKVQCPKGFHCIEKTTAEGVKSAMCQ